MGMRLHHTPSYSWHGAAENPPQPPSMCWPPAHHRHQTAWVWLTSSQPAPPWASLQSPAEPRARAGTSPGPREL